jgi:hypothetical protein
MLGWTGAERGITSTVWSTSTYLAVRNQSLFVAISKKADVGINKVVCSNRFVIGISKLSRPQDSSNRKHSPTSTKGRCTYLYYFQMPHTQCFVATDRFYRALSGLWNGTPYWSANTAQYSDGEVPTIKFEAPVPLLATTYRKGRKHTDLIYAASYSLVPPRMRYPHVGSANCLIGFLRINAQKPH